MPFIPENELEKMLVEAVRNPAAGPVFYRLLLESDLLVLGSPADKENASEQFSLEPGDRLNLVSGEKDGKRYLPIFSSLKRMQDYIQDESKYLRVNGRALLDLTRGAPVTLNPASEYGKELTADQVRQLLDGPRITPRLVEGEAEPPAQLMRVLGDFFATRPDIQTAWMTLVSPDSRTGETHPLLGIETTADWPLLMQALQAAASGLPGAVFDVQRVDRLNPVGLAGALLQLSPFYQRRSLN